MPVRLLNSPVLKWPDRQTVENAAEEWAVSIRQSNTDVVCVGYFGSYARGNWGVGSDLDLVIIVIKSDKPFMERSQEFDTTTLPISTDLLVYTEEEWKKGSRENPFIQTIAREAVWVG